MPQQPWMKLYAADWLGDIALRRSSLAARGLWADLLCLMHQCPNRGVLANLDGTPWSDDDIARAIAWDSTAVLEALHELLANGVASRSNSGAIFSRRMAREQQKSAKCSDAGKAGAQKRLASPNSSTLKGQGKGEVKGHAKGRPQGRSSYSSSSVSDFTQVEVPERDSITEDQAAFAQQKRPETPEIIPSDSSGNPASSQLRQSVKCVIEHYRSLHPRSAMLGPKSREWKLIEARLREGFTVNDLIDAIDGNHRSPFHAGDNEHGRKYHSLDLIFRDASRVQQFMEVPEKPRVFGAKTSKTLAAASSFLARRNGQGEFNLEPEEEPHAQAT